MDTRNWLGALRRDDRKPLSALMAPARRRFLSLALVASGLVGAVEQTPIPPPTQATTVFAGQTYQVIDEYYVDAKGTYWKPLVVTTTAYAPTEAQCDDTPGDTATGSDARRVYGIAADPRAIPYGTVLRVPGYGDAPVDDTGGAMRQGWARGIVHLDLRIPLRRYDGHWRSEDEATQVAMDHGVRRDRIVLMKVTMPVVATR